MTPDELNIIPRIEMIGEVGADGYAVDFNNVILGSPYLTGTGYLPTLEAACEVASKVLFILDILAFATLHADPEVAESFTDPEREAASSWATIVSAARKGDKEDGDPVHEEHYDREGDTIIDLDVNVAGFSLTVEEVDCLRSVVEEAARRRHHLFAEEGIIVKVVRRPVAGEPIVDVSCERPYRHELMGRHTMVGRDLNAVDATDEQILRAVYGDQHIFDTGPPPVVEVESLGAGEYRVKVTS